MDGGMYEYGWDAWMDDPAGLANQAQDEPVKATERPGGGAEEKENIVTLHLDPTAHCGCTPWPARSPNKLRGIPIFVSHHDLMQTERLLLSSLARPRSLNSSWLGLCALSTEYSAGNAFTSHRVCVRSLSPP